MFVGCSKVLSDTVSIIKYCEGSKKYLNNPVPNGDFPILHCLGIGSSVSDIHIVKQCFWIELKFITEDSNAIHTIITTI